WTMVKGQPTRTHRPASQRQPGGVRQMSQCVLEGDAGAAAVPAEAGAGAVSWPSMPAAFAVSDWYSAALIRGCFCKYATIAQIVWSSCVAPQAGMAVIFRPCLMIQNASAGSGANRVRFGGLGYKPSRSSEWPMPGARWQPVHISA